MRNIFIVNFILLASFLSGCGGGFELPPLRPQGEISGVIVNGAIEKSIIRVFSITGNKKGEKLGETTSLSDGSYALSVRAKSQVVLVEVSEGSYTEPSSGKIIILKEGEVLRTVALYQSGEPLTAMVSPVTHISAGYAMFKISNGENPVAAVSDSTAEISDVFGFDITQTRSKNIRDRNNQDVALNYELINGFFLAAISGWTEWVGAQQASEPHLNYNSIGLSQLFYDDILADGFLDGRSTKVTDGEVRELFYGQVKIDSDVYRVSLAQYMLVMANHSANQTSISASDLLDYTYQFASNLSSIFGNQAPGEFEEAGPAVYSLEAENAYKNGEFYFTALIGGVIGAESVEFFIDDTFVSSAENPLKPFLNIDTSAFPDGDHQIKVVAKNVFGNAGVGVFTYRFDNTSPTLTVTSALMTNQEVYEISGTYSDLGVGAKEITVQDTTTAITTDGRWTSPVSLTEGVNKVQIKLTDQLGNEKLQEINVKLDTIAPVINTDNGHGFGAFFVDGGIRKEELSSENLSDPLLIFTTAIDLNGVGINRTSLVDNEIPFFAFKPVDPQDSGVASSFENLAVLFKYSKNGQVLTDWKKSEPVEGEYLFPVVTEALHPEWMKSTSYDEHVIDVRVKDIAGNEVQGRFSFKVDFHVGNINEVDFEVTATDVFQPYDGAGFSERADLYNQSLSVASYNYTNDTNYAIYIKLSDSGDHQLQRSYDEAIRVNKVRWRVRTEWQVKSIVDTNLECPKQSSGSWKNVDKIYNYSVSSWELKELPVPIDTDIENVLSDDIPASKTSEWLDFGFDASYSRFNATTPDGTKKITYEFDYVNDPSLFNPEFSLISSWSLLLDGSTGNETVCDDLSFFQQRQVSDAMIESGYPKNQLTENIASDPINFQTQKIIVDDIDEGSILPENDWYRIPPGRSVWIKKIINSPNPGSYNDIDVADMNTFASYETRRLDKELTWTVNQQLAIQLRHDAGPENVSLMGSTLVELSAPDNVYRISAGN